MPTSAFYSGAREIGLNWGSSWSGIRVTVDGIEVAGPADAVQARRGLDVQLDDGTRIAVHLAPRWGILQLQVTHDGHFVGSASGNALRYLNVAGAMLGIHAAILACIAVSRFSGTLDASEIELVIEVAALGVLAFLTWLGSRVAAWLAAGLETALFGLTWLASRTFPSFFWAFGILLVYRGIPAAIEIAARQRRAPPADAGPYRAPST
jgi:hypothetical protein